MRLEQYMGAWKLAQHVRNGLVEVRYHKTLPLRLYTHTRKAVLENVWDEITTKCRGLVVDKFDFIIARPFEKFFNVETTWRPETLISAIPLSQPEVSDKLDGSLGILYTWDGKSYIATKGSFFSDQAVWATDWYHRHVGADFNDWGFVDDAPTTYPTRIDRWPRNHTPIFEIIAESVQHHVVHYHGVEGLVLITIINNDTGEELSKESCEIWAKRNNLKVVDHYTKSLGEVLNEDRKNKEGYVLSWPRPGKPPLKIKVKHQSFLDLQKVVHAATPKAILEALTTKNVNLLNTWIGQTSDPLGAWVKEWVSRLNFKYAEFLLKARHGYLEALASPTRKGFAQITLEKYKPFAPIIFALLDDKSREGKIKGYVKDRDRIIWRMVAKHFEKELSTPFAFVDVDEVEE